MDKRLLLRQLRKMFISGLHCAEWFFVYCVFKVTYETSLYFYSDRWVAVDIGFVVDASSNVSPEMWRDFKDIVKRTVDRYHVAPSSANVGMVTYGVDAKMLFNFNDKIPNNYEVRRVVDKAPLVRGIPRLDRGLLMASRSLFTEENGMRRWVPKVRFVL